MSLPAASTDGRTRRAERTRESIVDALLALLEDGDLRPTGERIAERAGVSLRALWTNFKDMEGLFAAVGERLVHWQRATHRPIAPDLPLPRRLTRFCEQRARVLESLAPAARAARLREPFSAQLRRNRTALIALAREEIEELFGPELDAAGPARDQLLTAVLAASTWSAWSMLRDEVGLPVTQARAVLLRTVTALLAPAADDVSGAVRAATGADLG
jgi:AcrR family transcriptional regulator